MDITNAASLLTYGALAQHMFNMRPGTLQVEFHVLVNTKVIKIARMIKTKQNEDPYNWDVGEYVVDVVHLTHFSNIHHEEIYMGYSERFNILVIGIPQSERRNRGYEQIYTEANPQV